MLWPSKAACSLAWLFQAVSSRFLASQWGTSVTINARVEKVGSYGYSGEGSLLILHWPGHSWFYILQTGLPSKSLLCSTLTPATFLYVFLKRSPGHPSHWLLTSARQAFSPSNPLCLPRGSGESRPEWAAHVILTFLSRAQLHPGSLFTTNPFARTRGASWAAGCEVSFWARRKGAGPCGLWEKIYGGPSR